MNKLNRLSPEAATKVAEGYELHLYCDHENPRHNYGEFPLEYFGEKKSEVRMQAKSAGWVIRPNGTATCPKCCKQLGIGIFK